METRIHIALLLIVVAPILAQDWQKQDTCGLQYNGVQTMIVGGQKADEFEYPWQAAMYVGGRRICGATLIDRRWILTAAHCVSVIFEPELFEFRVGSTSLANETSATQVQRASEIYVHPKYESSGYDYDIALFKLEGSLEITPNYEINFACLPTMDMDSEFGVGENATVTGWGALVQGGATPDELYEVVVPIVDQDQCNTSYSGDITDNMICAGVPEGGIDSCQGDSGGPMVALSDDNPDQYYVIGVVSWGEGCAQPNYPGVYTRVTQFEDWIKPIFNNGVPDALDGTCEADEFLCRGGLCISNTYRCSGSIDCYYGTDEEFCDGLLKMFDVFYYKKINPDDVAETILAQTSKEACADICLDLGCHAFDVIPDSSNTFTCTFAMAGYTDVEEANDVERTHNHFELVIKAPGYEFNQAAGVIATPGYFTDPEVGSQIYTWNINVPVEGRDSLLFRIHDVNGTASCEDLDSDFALLSSVGGDAVEMTSFCLSADVEGAEFTVHSKEAMVELLTSDASQYGFLLEFESYYDCNNVYEVGPGVVMSPNYPSDYPNSVQCTTHLKAPEGEVVYFSFDQINIEAHPTCLYDRVTVYNGSSSDAPVLAYYCGEKVPRTQFQSVGRDMFIVFTSDSSVTAPGFRAEFDFGIAMEPTADPNLAKISSLENELSVYKFGIAGTCVFGILLIIVLAASVYTLTKREEENAAKVAKLGDAEKGDAKDGYSRVGGGYVKMDDESDGGESRAAPTHDSQGSQATKTVIIQETGNEDYENVRDKGGIDEVDGGEVNEAFESDYAKVVHHRHAEETAASDEAEAVAAVEAAVESGEEAKYANTTTVFAEITPRPDDVDDLPPPPPPETTPPPPPDSTEDEKL